MTERLIFQGCEAAARRQGKHKLRVWLNISSSGVKIMDERTGVSSRLHMHQPFASNKRLPVSFWSCDLVGKLKLLQEVDMSAC